MFFLRTNVVREKENSQISNDCLSVSSVHLIFILEFLEFSVEWFAFHGNLGIFGSSKVS